MEEVGRSASRPEAPLPTVSKRFHEVSYIPQRHQYQWREFGSRKFEGILKPARIRTSYRLQTSYRQSSSMTNVQALSAARKMPPLSNFRRQRRQLRDLFRKLNECCLLEIMDQLEDKQNHPQSQGNFKQFAELRKNLESKLNSNTHIEVDPDDLREYFRVELEPMRKSTVRTMQSKARRH